MQPNGTGTGQPNAQWGSGPYDDPANLLRVYPFATYTPTARVASHFAPHTVAYSAPSTSAGLYPQYSFSGTEYSPDAASRVATAMRGQNSYGGFNYQQQQQQSLYQPSPFPTTPQNAYGNGLNGGDYRPPITPQQPQQQQQQYQPPTQSQNTQNGQMYSGFQSSTQTQDFSPYQQQSSQPYSALNTNLGQSSMSTYTQSQPSTSTSTSYPTQFQQQFPSLSQTASAPQSQLPPGYLQSFQQPQSQRQPAPRATPPSQSTQSPLSLPQQSQQQQQQQQQPKQDFFASLGFPPQSPLQTAQTTSAQSSFGRPSAALQTGSAGLSPAAQQPFQRPAGTPTLPSSSVGTASPLQAFATAPSTGSTGLLPDQQTRSSPQLRRQSYSLPFPGLLTGQQIQSPGQPAQPSPVQAPKPSPLQPSPSGQYQASPATQDYAPSTSLPPPPSFAQSPGSQSSSQFQQPPLLPTQLQKSSYSASGPQQAFQSPASRSPAQSVASPVQQPARQQSSYPPSQAPQQFQQQQNYQQSPSQQPSLQLQHLLQQQRQQQSYQQLQQQQQRQRQQQQQQQQQKQPPPQKQPSLDYSAPDFTAMGGRQSSQSQQQSYQQYQQPPSLPPPQQQPPPAQAPQPPSPVVPSSSQQPAPPPLPMTMSPQGMHLPGSQQAKQYGMAQMSSGGRPPLPPLQTTPPLETAPPKQQKSRKRPAPQQQQQQQQVQSEPQQQQQAGPPSMPQPPVTPQQQGRQGMPQYMQPQFQQYQQRPIPYNFLPPSATSSVPPTPSTLTGASPSQSNLSNTEYFENYVNRTLSFQSPKTEPNGVPAPNGAAAPLAPPPGVSPFMAPPRPLPPPPSVVIPVPNKKKKKAHPAPVSHDAQPSPAKKAKTVETQPSPVKKAKTLESHSTASPRSSQIYISVPKLSPAQKKSYQPAPGVNDEEEDDSIDWGTNGRVDKDAHAQRTRILSPDFDDIPVVGTGRTGDKDTRSALDKLQNTLEDIFEESDTFDAEPSRESVSSSRFFDSLSRDGTHPLLAAATINNVTRRVTRVQKNQKRQRLESNRQAVAWDVENLSRLFRMLERVMNETDDLEVFPNNGRKTVVNGSPTRKGKKSKKVDEEPKDDTPDIQLTEDEVLQAEERLTIMSTAAAAALCVLVVLDSDGLPKQLYSEDLLSLAVTTIRDEMTKVLFPVIEGLAGEKMNSDYLAHLVTEESAALAKTKASKKLLVSQFQNPILSSVAQSTCAAVPHIATLIGRPDMSFSDTLVIQTVYLAIGPVFVNEPSSKRGNKGGPSWSVMKSLRMEALGCLRGAFAKYEDQRQWIIEEILGSLGRGHEQGSRQTHFQLSNGSSINTLSALLLQLIQASSHGVGDRIRKLRSSQFDYDAPSDQQDIHMAQADAKAAAQENQEFIIVTECRDLALRSTHMIALYLFQKCGTGKANKVTTDTDYKAILDTFVTDLLNALYRPEWPAASLFVNILSKIFVGALDEGKDKASHSSEANAARSIALDYLGDIGAKLRSFNNVMQEKKSVPSLDEVISDELVADLPLLLEAHASIQNFLSSAAREDTMFVSSGELSRVLWSQELHQPVERLESLIQKYRMDNDEEAHQHRENLQSILRTIRKASHDVWTADEMLFEMSQPTPPDAAWEASLAVSRCRPLQGAADYILHALLKAMGSTVVNLRSKALRGLGSIVVADPDVLKLDIVKTGIEDRLSDTSPAVRDAAVDLIGKYIVQRSELADQYFHHISMRVTDAGLGVRKRVVKLLRDMFNVTTNDEVKINICCKLIEATNDEDDGVTDLAVKSLTEILFPPSNFDPAQAAALLVDVIKDYRGKDESLKAALEAVGANGQTQRYAQTIDSLISRMVDATEQSEFNATSHIKAIALLSFDDPALIDNQKATVLLTYLRTATNAEEARTNELLLEIFTRSIPFMPKASSSFAQELSKIVRGFVGKPPNIDALKNIVACYCAVTKHLTQEWAALFMVLRSCLIQIRGRGLANANSPAIAMVYFITALITEFAKPEELAAENSQVEEILRGITDQPLQEYLLDNYIAFSGAASSQKVPSLCLAALFRAYPPLILQEKSAVWMQRVFSSDDMESKAYALEMLRDFLRAEAERRTQKKNKGNPKKQGVDDLIGSAADLHESGVSTALVQRNVDYVIAGAKSNHPKLQSAAMEVFEFTINQGLYHPLHLFPILISLEAGADRQIAEQALALHTTLHTKHPSLLNVRYLEFARSSYDYLRTITAEPVGHYNGTPGLGGWYDLLSEKRAWRLEFLRALVKAFDFELMGNEKIEPGFVLYIAENLSTFNYQLQEEVMCVVQHLSHVVSEGTAVANAIELGKVMGMEDEPLADKMAVVSETEQFNAERLANASIVVGIALLLKNLLLDGYGLTEDKCLKFIPGKKSAMGDRAATNRFTKPPPLDHSRIPLVRGVETVRDFLSQQATFLHMMREDGMLGQLPAM